MDFDSLKDDSAKAPNAGAAMSFDKLQDDSERYGGVSGGLKAFGLGAGRSATFGLSDEFLVNSGAMKPEDIKAYGEQNPISSGAGEVAGVLGAILAPEGEILGAASAPVRGVAELGGAATEAALPLAQRAASLAVNPETSPVVHKILSQAGAHAAGSAVEGAAYGLGQSVSEHALGDPDLNAEKVIANVGTAALLGGGLGAVFGAGKGAIQAKFPKFLSEVDKAAVESGDFEAIAKASDLSESDKNGFLDGLRKRKSDAKEIEAAAKEIGAPVLPGMVSANETVQHVQSSLLESDMSYAALRAREIAGQGLEKAGAAVEGSLGAEGDATRATLGEGLGQMVSGRVDELNKPIGELYNELSGRYETIPLSEKSAPSIARNIRAIDEIRLSPSSPEAKIAARVADEIENLKTVDDVRKYKSMLNRSVSPTASSGEKHMVSVLSEKLSNLEQNSVVRFAENVMKTDKAEAKIKSLLDLREAADAQYSVFKDKLNRLGDILGKRRVYGAQDLLHHIENMTPEQIANKLLNKNNSRALDWFAREFPEGMASISQYQKGLIKEAAMKGGEFNIRRALSEIDKLPKEYRHKIFSPQELERLGYAKKYMDAFPKKYNTSNTANASALRSFFQSPTGAVAANARDFAMQKFLDAATAGGDATGSFIEGLSTVERQAAKTTKAISSGVNQIFSTKEAGSPVKGYLAISSKDRRDSHDKAHTEISSYIADPERLINKLTDSTQAVAGFAPKTAEGLQMTMSRAAVFLQSKLPGNGVPQSPLGARYQPSEAEVSKWHKYFSTVENPVGALHQVADGTIVPETMETLAAVYPRLLSEMQHSVADKMTDHVAKSKAIPYSRKLALSMFLGSDLVPSLSPVSMLANQNMLATATQAKAMQNQAQMGRVNKKSLGKMEKSNRLLTPMQENAQREDT